MLEGSILKQLADAHANGREGKRPLNFGVYYKNTLVALCHALEDSILESDGDAIVITAFQRGKWYLQEAERYGAIADKAQQIAIMAAPDAGFQDHPTSQRSNVAIVSLDEQDPVAQEWHLIILSPAYSAMVLCQELSDADYGAFGRPETDLERKFYGFWTFEPRLVLETAELAIAEIGHYNADLQHHLSQKLPAIAEHIDAQDTPVGLPTMERMGDIVARVVDYLQTHQVETQTVYHPSLIQPTHSANRLDYNLVSNELQAFLRVAQLLDQADVQNPMAGAEVAALVEAMGQLLDLPGWQLHRLRLAGLLHRLALLQNSEGILTPGRSLRWEEHSVEEPPSCPLVMGTQVLRTMPRLRAVATIITHHTEWWNGEGSPAHLAGDEIPLESRLLGLMAAFQGELAQRQPQVIGSDRFNGQLQADALQASLAACAAQAGDRWDPKLVDALTLLVNGLCQGLSLSVSLPKIAAGLWMINSHTEENLLPTLT